MKGKRIIWLLLALAFLAGCTREPAPSEPREILLQAGISDVEEATKAPCTITTITSLNPLNADVWVSTDSGTYPDSGIDGAASIAYHNTASFVSNSAQALDNPLYYPTDNSDVFLIGLYPQGKWELSGGNTTAACTFDGKTDIMFAPEATTTLAETTAAANGELGHHYPMLTFGHLLTWLRISVKAQDAALVNAWGALQSIQLQSAKNAVSMDLGGSTPVFSGSTTMATYATGGDTAFTGQSYTLTTSPVEKAYVLCAPVTATNDGDEYNLIVNTAYRTGLVVPVNLKAANNEDDYTGSTAGKQFSVVLNFGQGAVTTSVTAVNGWGNGGLANGDLTE